MKTSPTQSATHPTRRALLGQSMLGFGSLALTDLLAQRARGNSAPTNPLAAKPPHFAPRAKRIIYIFLDGGVSPLDSYDYKPLLSRDGGKPLPNSIRPPKFTFAPQGTILPSPWKFKQYGQSGKWCSNLFPHINKHIDELCFIHSLHHNNNDHITAKKVIHTGIGNEPRPTLGSWLAYGLGSENENLPAYIDILPGAPKSMPTAFLPSHYRGTAIGKPEKTARTRTIHNLQGSSSNAGSAKQQRQHLDAIQKLNRAQLNRFPASETNLNRRDVIDHELEAEIASMELAFRMQTEAPDLINLKGETQATMQAYGIGEPNTTEFGRACLMARRFAEQGVRYITITHSTNKYGNLWDQHSDLYKGHAGNAKAVDQPIAALLADLRSRGMLDDTLVMFGSEFGRTPTFEYKDGGGGRLRNGRDHNPYGFTMWLAGGGVRNGYSYGATDDYGYYATQNKVSIHDLHATLLHIMGIDHEKLTYRHGSRDHRLTDVFGDVVKQVLL